ncbi:hypothetical protein EVJ58_g2474 [Rhodofomes roseus]|uniref:Uncharacterized protein n=1 Tax=Rhodofomes roseus TaxID=34475 RepID=A0A4Y9YUB6_9APHY|nr:hypothetical protein EVJ58_g2474 [Rhodofomes roseus]
MQLLALALLASAPAAVTAASCSGLSTGAMVAIIVESVVIFLLIVWLLTILRQLQVARNKLKAALAHEEQEYKRGAASEGQADRHHSTTSLVQSPQDDHFEESQSFESSIVHALRLRTAAGGLRLRSQVISPYDVGAAARACPRGLDDHPAKPAQRARPWWRTRR